MDDCQQQQLDEIAVLEAIIGPEDFKPMGSQYEMKISIELPHAIDLHVIDLESNTTNRSPPAASSSPLPPKTEKDAFDMSPLASPFEGPEGHFYSKHPEPPKPKAPAPPPAVTQPAAVGGASGSGSGRRSPVSATDHQSKFGSGSGRKSPTGEKRRDAGRGRSKSPEFAPLHDPSPIKIIRNSTPPPQSPLPPPPPRTFLTPVTQTVGGGSASSAVGIVTPGGGGSASGATSEREAHVEENTQFDDFPRHTHVSVKCLPPLTLRFEYHPSYPSQAPPLFTLSCSWLDKTQLSKLCGELDDLFLESVGEVVVFKWREWLRESAFEFLKLGDGGVVLVDALAQAQQVKNGGGSASGESADSDYENDPRAYPECVNLAFTLSEVLEYDKAFKRREFEMSTQTCGICFTEDVGFNFIQLSCGHSFCNDCMTQFFSLHIQEGTVQDLICAEPKCKTQILPFEIKRLVTPELFDRYERLLFEKTLEIMSDVMYCPRDFCQHPVIIEKDSYLGVCPKCTFNFCTKCTGKWHVGTPCLAAEEIAKERAKASGGRINFQDLTQQAISLQWLSSNAKMCPTCGAFIQKVDGCNKVCCSQCRNFMCWVCRKKITGYDHFGTSCALWVEEQNIVQRRPENIGRLLVDAQLAAAGPGGRRFLKKCPRCATECMKMGNNNHIACWGCRTQFCFKCHQVILGTNHFGRAGGCPQHSAEPL